MSEPRVSDAVLEEQVRFMRLGIGSIWALPDLNNVFLDLHDARAEIAQLREQLADRDALVEQTLLAFANAISVEKDRETKLSAAEAKIERVRSFRDRPYREGDPSMTREQYEAVTAMLDAALADTEAQ